jgi:hypothetical protein
LNSTGRAYRTAPAVAISTGGIYGQNQPLITAVGIATINMVTGIVTAIGFDSVRDPWCVGTAATVGLGYTVSPLLTFSGLPSSVNATAVAIVGNGRLTNINVTNPGYGYAEGTTATVYIESPTGVPEQFRATGIATLRTQSIKTVGTIQIGSNTISGIDTSRILIGDRIRPQYRYDYPDPEISFIPSGTYVSSIGVGTIYMFSNSTNISVATTSFEFGINQCGIVTGIILTYGGGGYLFPPTITITNDPSEKNYMDLNPGISSATALSRVNSSGEVDLTYITDPGRGYILTPTLSIAPPSTITGIGTYIFNEVIRGSRSQTRARVKDWNKDTGTLKVSFVGIGSTTKGFYPGENIIGTQSGAIFTIENYQKDDLYDKYSQNDEIEAEADLILDFSESNPFGEY